jgi:hypothetical protein
MNATDQLQNEVQELVWALIDDQATDDDVRRLEKLLLDNDEARRTYVLCMQMHADLHFLLGGKQPPLPIPPQKGKRAEAPKPSRKPLPLIELRPMPPTVPLSELLDS